MKNTVFISLFWNVAQKIGSTGIQFIVQLILARLLLPEDYGVIAIVNVFILFARILVENGLNTALVQKRNADELDFSTVFVANLVLSIILYILLFLFSPFIARFFQMPELEQVIRVLSIIILFSGFNSIQQAFIQKKMLFKKLFLSSLIGILVSGVIGIVLAYSGKGIWALVYQQLISQLILTVALYFQIEWKPSFSFSFTKLKNLFKFGWKVLFSSIVTTIYNDLRTVIIGRFYSASALGFYNKGQQFPNLAVNNIVSSIQTVLFPTFSSQQDDLHVIKSMLNRSISVCMYIIAPLMIGLAMIAENLIVILLTDTWIEATSFLQIYCLVYLFRPIFATNLQAINGIGRSDIFMKMEIIKSVLYTIILIISVPFGVYAIAIGSLISSILSLFIYTYPNKKLIDFGFSKQIKSIMTPLLLSVIMGLIIYPLNFLNINRFVILSSQILIGICVYILSSIFFKVDSFYYLLGILKDLYVNRK